MAVSNLIVGTDKADVIDLGACLGLPLAVVNPFLAQLDLNTDGFVTAAELFTQSVTVNGLGGHDLIYGTDSINGDLINAGAGQDTVYGGFGGDTVNGQGGADTIYGDEGNDRLNGQGGGDTIYGGSGNDRVEGGDGNDVMYGDTVDCGIGLGGPLFLTTGVGKDKFVFTSADASDTDHIMDFNSIQDQIDLTAIAGLDASDIGTTFGKSVVVIAYGFQGIGPVTSFIASQERTLLVDTDGTAANGVDYDLVINFTLENVLGIFTPTTISAAPSPTADILI